MYKKIKLSVILREATLIQRTTLIVPGATFIQGATFIPESRVSKSHEKDYKMKVMISDVLLIADLAYSSLFRESTPHCSRRVTKVFCTVSVCFNHKTLK